MATAYTNEAPFYKLPAPKGYRAIDVLKANGGAVFIANGKKYSTTVDGANATLGGDLFYNEAPFFWIDLAAGLNEKHRALGFIDLLLTVEIEDAPGLSTSELGMAPYTNGWRMAGDSDKKDSQDIRAVADGQVMEFLDTRYKCSYYYGDDYYDGRLFIMTTPPQNASKTYYAGEYGILRMEVPRYPVRNYAFFIGANVLRPYNANKDYGSPFGGESDAHGLSYQGAIYTTVLSNRVIPVVDVKSPRTEGIWRQQYDDANNTLRPPVRQILLPARVPITFTGENSYRGTNKIVSWEWMAEVPGQWTPGRENYTAIFQTNGNYLVKLRIRSDAGDVVINDGTSNETGANNRPDFFPSPLPTAVTIVDPPNQVMINEPMPNPFLLGSHSRVVINFTLKQDTPISLGIFSVDGQLMATPLTSQGKYPAGYWSTSWDGKNDRGQFVADGVYFAVLSTPSGKYLTKIHTYRVN